MRSGQNALLKIRTTAVRRFHAHLTSTLIPRYRFGMQVPRQAVPIVRHGAFTDVFAIADPLPYLFHAASPITRG